MYLQKCLSRNHPNQRSKKSLHKCPHSNKNATSFQKLKISDGSTRSIQVNATFIKSYNIFKKTSTLI